MTQRGYYLSRTLALAAYAYARERDITIADLGATVGVSHARLSVLLSRSTAPKKRSEAVERMRKAADALARKVGYKGAVLEEVEVRTVVQ